jgi:hypothetical protein
MILPFHSSCGYAPIGTDVRRSWLVDSKTLVSGQIKGENLVPVVVIVVGIAGKGKKKFKRARIG